MVWQKKIILKSQFSYLFSILKFQKHCPLQDQYPETYFSFTMLEVIGTFNRPDLLYLVLLYLKKVLIKRG